MYDISKSFPLGGDLEEAAIWYNDGSTSLTTGAVIHPDKVRLNLYYYNHYSLTCGRACSCSAIGKQACHCSRVLAAFGMDIKMIFATVLGRKVKYMGEEI